MGLPRDVRLRKRPELRKVQNEGRRFPGSHVILLVSPRATGSTRFGVTASRRLGTAVARNRVRRRIREIMRVRRPSLAEGFDLLVIARSSAATAPFPRLQADLLKLLQAAGTLGTAGTEGKGR
jgi:ribonuclease P protein component